jgi:hypothetical protein
MIRAIAVTTGNASIVAGSGEPGDVDGPAFSARLHAPGGIAYHDGTLYIADSGNNKIKSMPFNPVSYRGE